MSWFSGSPYRPDFPGLEKLKSVGDFLEEENLRRTPLRYAPAPGDAVLPSDFALLIVDAQKKYCDPALAGGKPDDEYCGTPETDAVAERIASLLPAFRAAGVEIYFVYLSPFERRPETVDFHRVAPQEGDKFSQKFDDSAFANIRLAPALESPRRKTLLVCGFNASACIRETAIDGCRRDFDVWVMPDLCANDASFAGKSPVHALQHMQDAGAKFRTARDVLASLPTL
jgi:nicotinamidase-related amidase